MTGFHRRITIGKITRLRGLRGEVVVISSSGDYSIFEKLKEVNVSGDRTQATFKIEKRVRLRSRMALKLAGIDSPQKASPLLGCELVIDEKSLPKLPERHYYCYQLIGVEVVDKNGNFIGEIADIWENPGNDVFVVKSPKEEEILIPAVKEVIRSIDLEKGLMEVELIPGLLH